MYVPIVFNQSVMYIFTICDLQELKAKVEEVAKLSRRLPKIKDALAEAEVG